MLWLLGLGAGSRAAELSPWQPEALATRVGGWVGGGGGGIRRAHGCKVVPIAHIKALYPFYLPVRYCTRALCHACTLLRVVQEPGA
jgi:hypothetical protein